mmetsp:Transcript_12234/g.17391  ORF Transcript_12234/g.17391 Transcript_12234/m.17391 type:complete len:196 (-) Transcript_12234:2103-2690(-)
MAPTRRQQVNGNNVITAEYAERVHLQNDLMANESSLSNENTKVTLELSSSSSLTKKALLLSSSQDDDDAAVKSNDHEKGAMDDHPHEDDDDDDDATKNMYKNHGSGGGGTNLSTSTSIENIISLSSSMDERFEAEREANKLRHWREGPYAAGLVEVSWNDERLKQLQHRRRPDSTTTTTTSISQPFTSNSIQSTN